MITHRTILELRAALERLFALARASGSCRPWGHSTRATKRSSLAPVTNATSWWPASSSTLPSSERGRTSPATRTTRSGTQACGRLGVDHLFVPSVEEMYPAGFQTWVGGDDRAAARRRRAARHFRGVATVCLKLFNIVRPDVAYFGRKDAQQAALLGRLIRDLDLALELRVVPTVRDSDGVALSSRNAHLATEERAAARMIPQALEAGPPRTRRGCGDGRRRRPRGGASARTGVRRGAPLDGRVYLSLRCAWDAHA